MIDKGQGHRRFRSLETAVGFLTGLLFLLAGACVAGEGPGGASADDEIPKGAPEEVFRRKIDQLREDRDNILAQNQILRERRKEWESAMRDHEKIVEERDALLLRTKALANRADLQMEEIEAAKKEIRRAMKNVDGLIARQKEIEKEREAIQEQFDKSSVGRRLKVLEEERAGLKKRERDLDRDLKKTKRDLDRISRRLGSENKNLLDRVHELELETQTRKDEYETRINELQLSYAEAEKKREDMERHVKSLPTQYAKLARDRQRLVEETADMHYNLGVYYLKEKEYRRALAEFEEAVDLKPDHALATYNVAHYYAAVMKDKEKAVEYFKKYLQLSPDAADRDEVLKYISTWETWAGKGEKQ